VDEAVDHALPSALVFAAALGCRMHVALRADRAAVVLVAKRDACEPRRCVSAHAPCGGRD
jgi:hypothetical protein